MRIVVKPAGLIIVIAMIGILATLAFLKNKPTPAVASKDSTVTATPDPIPSGSPVAVKPKDGNLLSNPGFESPFIAVPAAWSGAKGKANGMAGTGWHDDSLWGPVDLEYAADKVKPHSGAFSQRMKILSAQPDGKCQFVQQLPGKEGATYRETIWVRASQKNVPVSLLLRQTVAPFLEYKSTTANVGTEWQKLTVEGTVSQAGDIFIMTSFNTPGVTVWIDDAKLTQL